MYYAIGVDLGGTNLRAGLVSAAGTVEALQMQPVEATADGDGLIAQIEVVVRRLGPAPGEVMGLGLGLPAALAGPERRVLPGLSNLGGLVGYPLAARLTQRLGWPCRLANDANLILLGEVAFGAGRGVSNLLCLTLGTGIGGGLLLDGKLREGPHGVAGEIGLTHVSDAFEGNVTLEALASASAVGRRGNRPAEEVFHRAAAGDVEMNALLASIYEQLGGAIANAHLLIDLERVLLCGGLAQAGEPLRAGVQAAFARHCPPEYQLGMEIVLGQLGEAAGILGAAQLWFG